MRTIVLFCFVIALVTTSHSTLAQIVKEGDVPHNVRATAVKQNKNEPVSSWVLDKNRERYVATTISVTAMRGIEISLEGDWLQTTEGVLPQKMPAAVMASAKKSCPEFELDNFFYVTAPGAPPFYSVDASSEDEDFTLSIDPAGKILEKESR